MRILLRIGAMLGFVVVAVGLTFDALAIVGVLYLLDRVDSR